MASFMLPGHNLPGHDRGELIGCGGAELRLFFAGGLAALERCALAIDKLNVFPVPDGDTGTNLMRTVAGAMQVAGEDSSDEIGVVAEQLASAALHHARGNSGTIFAQLCAGLAQAFAGQRRADAGAWAGAWELAATTARNSVNAPVDGTILTVARDAAAAARAASATARGLVPVWQAMVAAADATVAQTPRMLAVLERASVVDAGALGLALFLRGAVGAFTGEPLPDPATLMQPSDATRRVIEDASFPRYCTQFLLHAPGIDTSGLATRLASYGDSLDIAAPAAADGAERARLTHIHLHTDDPDTVVAYASTLGAVSGLKVEDMQRQRAMLLSGAEEPDAVAMIAIASGDGMRRLFESLFGVVAVVGRPEELDAALARVRARRADGSNREILVLANDEQAAAGLTSRIDPRGRDFVVVPTRNDPEGIAAALAFDPGTSAEGNAEAMIQAARRVHAVCVASPTPLLAASEAALAQLVGDGGDDAEASGLVTMYYGSGVSRAEIAELAARIERRFPGLETEVIAGGQPDCPLWIALESDER
jgi:DAK2 domain fusion protein YloV